ncbi:hypothetical protein GCM10027051_32630 [Niabella terrae]
MTFVSCQSGSSKNKKDKLLSDPDHPFGLTEVEKMSEADIASYNTQLSDLFDSMLLKGSFNGGILVAKGGNILYEKYVGFENPNKPEFPITDSTAFHLASTSKPFTGMAVLRLVQQGKIGLNDSLNTYFPGFPYPGVTVKTLLTHRSGLPNYLYFMEDKKKWPEHQSVQNQDVLDFLINFQPDRSYRAGTRFSYCNTNFALLALLLEKVTKQPYPQYMKDSIFTPLGMHHTFVYTPEKSGQVILSYRPSGALWEQDIFDDTYGDKNIYSTPRDLMKWDAMMYNDNFLSAAWKDSAYTPYSNERPSIHNYGLAWRLLMLPNGKKVIYHNGKWHGFTPAFARLTDEKVVIIIVGNRMNYGIYKAARQAYNLFGDYMKDGPGDDEEAAAGTKAEADNTQSRSKVAPAAKRTSTKIPAKVKNNKKTSSQVKKAPDRKKSR